MSTNSSVKEGSVMNVIRNSSVHVEWEIPNFFSLPHNGYEYLDSPSFTLSDAEWFIRVYPDLGSSVSLEVRREEYPLEMPPVWFSIGIKKADDSVFKNLFKILGESEIRWEPPYISRSELNEDTVVPNGVLTIFLVACVLGGTAETVSVRSTRLIPSSNGFETLSQNLKKLYLSGTEGDITFQVKDRQISAHKLILAARSTVFDAMFKADMTEKNSSTVNISDSVPDHFEKFLMYMYTGELNVISPTNASGLYYLADKYNLKELKEVCCEILTREICVDFFCDAAVLAFLHNEAELLEAATEFFIKHANDIFPTTKWASFVVEHFTLANELLIKMANKYCVKQL